MNKKEPLTPAVLHILLALSGGERHGYDIMRLVAEATDGKVQMGPGTLYGTLKRLLQAGLIVESDERPDPALDDARRRYYRLSDIGQKALADELERLEQVLAVARRKDLPNRLRAG